MLAIRVNVRTLAEFAYTAGDLKPAFNLAERMQEGTMGHQLRQAGYGPEFEKEVSLKRAETFQDVSLTLYGRADGLNRVSNPPIIEEIKVVRGNPRFIGKTDHPAHWAQATLYGYMLSALEGHERVTIRLIYMNMAGDEKIHQETMTRETLREAFLFCAVPYISWQKRLNEARERALPTLKALKFPYPEYRDGQRALAAHGYAALKAHTSLLAQAPTGIGKTAAALFAALKAMGEGHVNRIFYLTARTTARMAAEQALDRMRAGGLWLRHVTLTAKEKICPRQGGICDPTLCPMAIGYYDRRAEALREALDMDRLSRDQIETLAARYELCPFELQLDISENCDVVICDYNYVFDPRVRLKRFFQGRFDGGLLIDEAHNLPDRTREMLSAEVRLSDFESLAGLLSGLQEKEDFLYTKTMAVIEALASLRAEHERPGWSDEAPTGLSEALDMFADAAHPYLGSGGSIGRKITDLYFLSLQFTRVENGWSDAFLCLTEATEKDFRVRLWCADPSGHIAKCIRRTRGAALFSATLSPLSYYARLLGVEEDHGDATLALDSPFPTENLKVIRLRANTTLRARAESISTVANAILAMCRARKGNYLACFPSYAYMNLALRYIAPQAEDIDLLVQKSGMTENQREKFIASFEANRPRTLLGMTVMGGVFAEGVDLPGDRLIGAAIVGVGFPGLSLERAALAQSFEESGEPGDGLLNAYVYPGVQRVMQAAGRVIRTENDRGCVLLIDERYFQEIYETLLPGYWHIESASGIEQLGKKLENFWKKK